MELVFKEQLAVLNTWHTLKITLSLNSNLNMLVIKEKKTTLDSFHK